MSARETFVTRGLEPFYDAKLERRFESLPERESVPERESEAEKRRLLVRLRAKAKAKKDTADKANKVKEDYEKVLKATTESLKANFERELKQLYGEDQSEPEKDSTGDSTGKKRLTGKWGNVKWKELGVQDNSVAREMPKIDKDHDNSVQMRDLGESSDCDETSGSDDEDKDYKTRGLEQETASDDSDTHDRHCCSPETTKSCHYDDAGSKFTDTHAPGWPIQFYRRIFYCEGFTDEWQAVYNPRGDTNLKKRIDKLDRQGNVPANDTSVLDMLEPNFYGKEVIPQGTEQLARSVMKELLKAHKNLVQKFDGGLEIPTGYRYDAWRLAWQSPAEGHNFDKGEKGLCRMLQVFEALGPYRWQDRFLRCMTIDVGHKLSRPKDESANPGIIKDLFMLPRNSERNHVFSCQGQGVPLQEYTKGEDHLSDRFLEDQHRGDTSARKLIKTLEWMVRRVNYRWLRSPGFGRERSMHGVVYAWTPLLNDGLSAKTRLYWLKVLVDCDRESDVFKTLVGRSFSCKCWNSVKAGFYLDKGLREAWFIMLLLRIGRYMRAGEMPTMEFGSTVFFLIINFLLSFFLISVELVTIVVLFAGDNLTPKGGLRRYFSGWNTALVCAELVALVAVCRWIHYFLFLDLADKGWKPAYDANGLQYINATVSIVGVWPHQCVWRDYKVPETCIDPTCWYYENASLLMFIVFVKCNQLLVNMMCYRPVGEQVYLAFATMMEPSSLWFSSFMIFCGFSCVAAYYMLPIKENIVDNFAAASWNEVFFQGSGFAKSVMKVFRIAIMGDFDTTELEGVNGVVNSFSGDKTKFPDTLYETDDGEPTYFHFGIQVFTVAVCVCFNVLLLNVYIGLLGSVYGSLQTRRAEVFVEFRATFTVRALLLRTAANWLLSSCRPLLETIDPRWKSDPDSDERFKQHFIMYDTRVDKEIAALDLTHLGDDGGYEMAD